MICRTPTQKAKRRGQVLFINAVNEITRKNAQSYLEDKHIDKIASAYKEYKEIEGFSKIATIDDIARNNYSLSIPLYVRTNDIETQSEDISLEEQFSQWDSSSTRMRRNYELLNNLIAEEDKK